MAQLGIDTAQNVQLEYEVASTGDRILAAIIDLVVLIGWSYLAMLLLEELGMSGTGVYILFFAVPWTFYHLACELFMNGQSIGKRVRWIKVVRRDGQEAGIGGYLLRWLLRPVDSFYGIGIVVILVNGKGQRIGDLAGGTTVVSLRKRVALDQTLLVNVEPDHVVRYPRAAELTDGQARFMKEVLYQAKGPDRAMVLARLADKLRAILELDHELDDATLIETLLKDMVYLTGR